MTTTEAYTRLFRVGDLVRVRNGRPQRAPWKITADDTGCTPVHDPEPAYCLFNGRDQRYAYQSELEPAE